MACPCHTIPSLTWSALQTPPGTSFSSASKPKIRISTGELWPIFCKAWSQTRWPKLRTSLTVGRALACPAILLGVLSLSACRQDMHDQPKYKYLRPTEFFSDGRSARPLVENTVARGQLQEDSVFYTGMV